MGADSESPRFHEPRLTSSPSPGSTLVTIRAGAPSSPPLFCVHAEAGDVSLYYGIAVHLPPQQALLGLCAPATSELAAAGGLERIAERHVGEIRAVQPDGPYLILGECTGGALAYEIARQLEAGGAQVALLALVDAFAPGLPRLRRFMPRPLYRIVHRMRILGFHLSNLLRLGLRAKLAYASTRVGRTYQRLRARARDVLSRERGGGSPRPALQAAFAAYTPQPHARRVLLLRAAHLPSGIDSPADLGWRALAEEVQIETIPGYFTTPISEPGVAILAERLASHLARTTSGASTYPPT